MSVPIFKSTWMPRRFDAISLRYFILVRPGKSTPELIAHERAHIKQQKDMGWLYFWLWATNKRFRARVEIQAYRAQGASDASIQHVLYWKYMMTYDEAREFMWGYL